MLTGKQAFDLSWRETFYGRTRPTTDCVNCYAVVFLKHVEFSEAVETRAGHEQSFSEILKSNPAMLHAHFAYLPSQ